jgi:hypothetical protein
MKYSRSTSDNGGKDTVETSRKFKLSAFDFESAPVAAQSG